MLTLQQMGLASIWPVSTRLFGHLERFHRVMGAGKSMRMLDTCGREGFSSAGGTVIGGT
jgi:hypothetical protein